MKCEICNSADARKAIERKNADGTPEELYVCEECAAKEHAASKKKRSRSVTTQRGHITLSGDLENAPPFIGAIIDAVTGIVGEMNKAGPAAAASAEKPVRMKNLSLSGVNAEYLVSGGLHLEGLFLIGEIDACRRALHALGMDIVAHEQDGVKNPGHVYKVTYSTVLSSARTVLRSLVRQERNARGRLLQDMEHIFDDAICRALAIIKNCRLLAAGEYYDMLSTLRLAALAGKLDGIDVPAIEEQMETVLPGNAPETASAIEVDRIDAERAVSARSVFLKVCLKETGEKDIYGF